MTREAPPSLEDLRRGRGLEQQRHAAINGSPGVGGRAAAWRRYHRPTWSLAACGPILFKQADLGLICPVDRPVERFLAFCVLDVRIGAVFEQDPQGLRTGEF